MKLAAITSVAIALLLLSTTAESRPGGRGLKQGAGVGAGCNSIASQSDNALGYGVKNAENGLVSDMAMIGGRRLQQGAGVGAGCDSIASQSDNAVGYGVENAENGLAHDINPNTPINNMPGTGRKLSATSALPGRSLLQEDKIGDGLANVMTAAGAKSQAAIVKQVADSTDGDLTGDGAQTGKEVGQLEVDTVEPLGGLTNLSGRKMLMAADTTGRSLLQEDKIGDGLANVMTAAGAKNQAPVVKQVADNTDGDLTGDGAEAGKEVGQLEVDSVEPLGGVTNLSGR